MALAVELIPAFQDNYIFLLHDQEGGAVAVVDPGDAHPVQKALDQREWKLDQIFITHHHPDHIGGVQKLRDHYSCQVIGADKDKHRLPGLTLTVREGDQLLFGKSECQVIEVPGHTLGHVAYWFKEDRSLFCGDTLFAMGCGRLFEGTAEQMWESLSKLSTLPRNTQVFCAHEYTQANGEFATSLEPQNTALLERLKLVEESRKKGEPTIPTTLEWELLTNPFLRPKSEEIQRQLGLSPDLEDWQVFAEVRKHKDHF
ncbi:MAG: hydroxyacylglutathione hydrolase [Bdellovibrionaceae bacterium]|nr:hydroxyacylglutathione hydrolase [Bdellovibrionales bacterium]MCB9084229.1 hydroxyacylglutathione hydrolase [Pseudobdellovibrionaceae bacterium]